jgi:hypothetical protein
MPTAKKKGQQGSWPKVKLWREEFSEIATAPMPGRRASNRPGYKHTLVRQSIEPETN